MKFGLDKIFGKGVSKISQNLASKVMTDLVEKSAEPITADAYEAAINAAAKSLKNKLIQSGGKVAESAGTGFLMGSTIDASNQLAEAITNKASGKEVFEPKTWGQRLGEVFKSGASMAVGGGVLGAATLPFSKTQNYIAQKVSEAKTPEDIANLKQEVLNGVQGQNYTPEQAQQMSDLIDKYVQVNAKIPPSVQNRTEVANKILEREDIQNAANQKAQEAENVDEAFKPDLEKEAEILNNKAQDINDEIVNKSEQPEQVEQQQETTPTQEPSNVEQDEVPRETKEVSNTNEVSKEPETVSPESAPSEKLNEEQPITEEQVAEQKIKEEDKLADAINSRQKVYKLVNQMDEPTDARSLALNYFAGGGKVDNAEMRSEFTGGKDTRFRIAKDNKTADTKGNTLFEPNGKTVDQVAHSLWDNLPEHLQDNISTSDIKNELIDVMSSHSSREETAKEYVSKYHPDFVEAAKNKADREQFAEEEKKYRKEIADEEKALNSLLEDQSKQEEEYETSPEFIKQLIDQYESEGNKQDAGKDNAGNQGESNPENSGEQSNTGQKTNEQIATEKLISDATTELKTAKESLASKRKELDKGLLDDQEDLFGDRKSSGNKLFDERVDPAQREKALQPFKDGVTKAQAELDRLNKVLDKYKNEPTAQLSIPLTKSEENAFKSKIKTSDADKIIEDKGLTAENLSAHKHLFEGHPFTPEDYRNIKNSLDEEHTSNPTADGQQNTGGDGNKTAGDETPAAEVKDTQTETHETAPAGENTDAENEAVNKVGIYHEALKELAGKVGLPEIERGKTFEIKELADRGRKLLEAGADPDKVMDEFYSSGKTDENGVSVIRAKIEETTKKANAVEDKNSKAFKEHFDELAKWMQVVKDMGNFAHRLFKSFQGNRDLDTDAFTYNVMSAERHLGRELNDAERDKIARMTKEIADLKGKVGDFDEKLRKAIDEELNKPDPKKDKKSIAEDAKALAAKIRRAKVHRPGVFSAATPGSLVWDAAVETVAKTIEGGGVLADAIKSGVEYIKNSDWYKGLSSDNKKEAEESFVNAHRKVAGYTLDSLREMFADKKGTKFTHDEAKAIWEYAKKEYLDKGDNFPEMLASVANDLGFSMQQINHAIVTPKARPISDEMWKRRSDLAKGRANIQRWISDQGGTYAYKIFRKSMNTFREAAVFGHGAIFVGTHAMPTLFDLPRAKYTVRALLNAYKLAYGKSANYELAIADLKNSENYIKAQRAGLQNNPERIGSDAEIISHNLKWLTEAGERGFNAIKILRQNLFDAHYNNLPENLQNDPNILKEVAQIVNNATGATNYKVPNWMRETMFAGGMEMSRWERIIKNPTKAAGILGKIANGKATPAEKVFFRIWATRAGTIAGVYTAALAINNALNTYLYPNDDSKKVNFFNPSKGDWFKPKIGNMVLDPTSGMNTSIRFVTALATMPFEKEGYVKKNNEGDSRLTAIGKRTLKYGLGKLSPGYTTIAEFALKHDFNGNTVPYSDDKPYYKHYNRKLTWKEYLEQKLPLPVAEGFTIYNEAAHQTGVDNNTWDAYKKGWKFGAFSGLTGVRAYENEEKKSSAIK